MGKRSYADVDGKNKSAPKQTARRFNDAKFVQRELTSDEQADCKLREFTESDFQNLVEKYSEEYSITFKWDNYSNSPACFMRPIDPSHENTGYILTGRGSTFAKAFKQLLYKHEVLCGDGTWSQWDKERAFSFDD